MVIQYALHVQGSGAAAAASPACGGTLHKFTINKKMAAQEAVVPLVEAMHEKVRGILATIVVRQAIALPSACRGRGRRRRRHRRRGRAVLFSSR